MFKQSVITLATVLSLAPYAMAANYPVQVYDATYVVSNAAGKTDMRMASDGKGHFLTQTTTGGQQYGTIVDYLNNTTISLIPQGKMAMKSKLSPNGGYVADEASVKQIGGKSLGSKTINGHPCHGFEYTTGDAKTQTWIGDDCKILVQSITNSSGGKSVTDLKTIAGRPSDDLFKVPAGYRMMGQ